MTLKTAASSVPKTAKYGACVGALCSFWHLHAHPGVGALCLAFAACSLSVGAMLFPRASAPFFHAVEGLLGWSIRLLSEVLLFLCFACVITPAGLLRRLLSRHQPQGRWQKPTDDGLCDFTRPY